VEKVKSEDPCGGSLLNLAFVSSLNEIFASLILRKELELFGINRTSPFLSNEVNSILVFHSQFDESSGHKNRGSAESGYTVYSNASVGSSFELAVDQFQPSLDYLLSRS